MLFDTSPDPKTGYFFAAWQQLVNGWTVATAVHLDKYGDMGVFYPPVNPPGRKAWLCQAKRDDKARRGDVTGLAAAARDTIKYSYQRALRTVVDHR